MISLSKSLVGLDLGSSSIKAFMLKDSSKGFILEKFTLKPVVPDSIVDGSIMDSLSVQEAIKEVVAEMKIKGNNVATSISGHSVIVKTITTNMMTKEELKETIMIEAEQYIPFDVEEVYIDFHIIGPDPKDETLMNVLLVAAKKEQVDEYANILRNSGLNPVMVDIDSFALENCYLLNYEDEPNKIIAMVNIGSSRININIMKDKIPVFVRDINLGGKNYTEAIQKDLQINFEEAERLKKGDAVDGYSYEDIKTIINSVSEELCQEVIRSMDFFRNTAREGQIDKIYLSGGCAKVKGLDELIKERASVDVVILNPFKNIKIGKAIDIAKLTDIAPLAAVGIGLAMRRVGDS